MPIIEMYLLFTVAGYINAWPTVALVMLTAVIGISLLKRQGLATLTRGVGRMNSGQVPGLEIAEGILLGIAGAFLITPGFVTDTLGFLLLFPPTRIAIAGVIMRNATLQTNMSANASFYEPNGEMPLGSGGRPARASADIGEPGATVEGEYQRKDSE
tara:strand:+ start:327 stop:797 length:471 start_codon:yes stop_codon:yes gene_type:complete